MNENSYSLDAPLLIIPYSHGQMCNRLYVLAHSIAFASEHKLALIHCQFLEYSSYFAGFDSHSIPHFPDRSDFFLGSWTNAFLQIFKDTLRVIVAFDPPLSALAKISLEQILSGELSEAEKEILCKALPAFGANLAGHLNQGNISSSVIKIERSDHTEGVDMDAPDFIARVTQPGITVLEGARFAARKSVAKHLAEIREYFAPSPAHIDNINKLVSEIRGRGNILVGVHIRLGDFRVWWNGIYAYDPDGYAKLMKRLTDLFPGKSLVFLVCSNETLDKNTFATLNYKFGTGQSVEDLYALASCDYLIGPSSTFSGWASFYGEVPFYTIFDINVTPAFSDFKIAPV